MKVECPQDLSMLFDNLEDPAVRSPSEPTPDEDGNISRTEQETWEIKIKSCVKMNDKIHQNLTVVFNVALGQCGPDTLAKVDSSPRWETMSRNKHAKGLVEAIKSHYCHSSSNRHPRVPALSTRIKLHDHRQQEGQSVQDYAKELNAIHDVVKEIDGGQGVGIDGEAFEEIEKRFQVLHGCAPLDPGILERHNNELAAHSDTIILVHITLRGALPSKHKLLKEELQTRHNLGQNLCPESLTSVNKVLQNYVGKKERPLRQRKSLK